MSDQFGRQLSAVLSGDSQRITGDDAVSMNIAAGSAVSEAVRTTLGPRGMDKMLVSGGDVVVTNDGVTVLEKMDVDHPVAEMIVDVAETQESEVGDGTTTAVVIAGELLSEAESLLDRGIHPSTIVSGFRRAGAAAEGLLDDVGVEVSADDTELLEAVARTAMTGKSAENATDELAPMVVEAVRRTMIDGEPDVEAVKTTSFPGETIADTRLVDGMTVDINPEDVTMPRSLEDVDIVVFDGDLELQETAPDAEITVSSAEEFDAFVEREREELTEIADGLVEADVDVLFTSGSVDDELEDRLAREGLLVVTGVRDPDVEKLVRATGASRVTRLADLTEEDLGYAGNVRQETIRNIYGPKTAKPEKTFVVEDLEETNAVSFLLRGGTDHVVDELERGIDDALRAVAVTIEEGVVLPGGGGTEIALARGLRAEADSVSGREQLAVESVADALESIPHTLAVNAGIDAIDALVEVRSRQDSGDRGAGIDGHDGGVVDMHEAGVVEPRRVKSQAIGAGIEAVTSILRIDDVVSVGDLSTGGDEEEEPGGGGMGGMGGMGGGMGGMM